MFYSLNMSSEMVLMGKEPTVLPISAVVHP